MNTMQCIPFECLRVMYKGEVYLRLNLEGAGIWYEDIPSTPEIAFGWKACYVDKNHELEAIYQQQMKGKPDDEVAH